MWEKIRSFALPLLCVLWFSSTAMAAPAYTNSIGMEFVRVPAGTFIMGNSTDESAHARTVTISKPFYLGKYEVTTEQWAMMQQSTLNLGQGDSRPAANLSWEDTQIFIQALNIREETDKYRLPTEVEWEYAARAGVQSAYPPGETDAAIGFHAWYNFNSGGGSQPAGLKRGNAFGLHDMQGNVSEWVSDWSSEEPSNPATGQRRVARGCSWRDDAKMCTFTRRFPFDPRERNGFVGFRILREVEE